MFERCPKCRHRPLPQDQRLPAECPACGVVLAKLALTPAAKAASQREAAERIAARRAGAEAEPEWLVAASSWTDGLAAPPERADPLTWSARAALLAAFAVWGLRLIAMDHRSGEMAGSFIHGPLLVFHEAGHVIFRFGGEWLMVFGGTLGQLLMPAILAGALLVKNRDPFGAAIGLWLLGVSLLDVAPYVHDALHPQLMLLSGRTGEEGGHDWIYLLSAAGWLDKAPALGAWIHKLGALVVLVALGWAGWTLNRQRSGSPVKPR